MPDDSFARLPIPDTAAVGSLPGGTDGRASAVFADAPLHLAGTSVTVAGARHGARAVGASVDGEPRRHRVRASVAG